MHRSYLGTVSVLETILFIVSKSDILLPKEKREICGCTSLGHFVVHRAALSLDLDVNDTPNSSPLDL